MNESKSKKKKKRENAIKLIKLEDLEEPIEKKFEFLSLSFTRLFAAVIFIIIGFMTLIIFSPGVGHHQTNYGNAIFLGGPSFFYVTGLPAFLFGFGLLIYFFFSIFKGRFLSSQSFVHFQEIRPRLPRFTEIRKQEVEAFRYQNNHLGPKFTWIIVLTPFIVFQLLAAFPLFFAPRAAPYHVLSWTFLIISLLEVVAVILLVVYPQSYFEIATKQKLYEMWLSPYKKVNFNEDFLELFECTFKSADSQKTILFDKLNSRHLSLFSLSLGIFLVASTLIMIIGMLLFGSLFWWLGLMYGLVLIVKGYMNDFGDANDNIFSYDNDSKEFKFMRKFKGKFQFIAAKAESVKVGKWFRKLDFFDVGLIGGILVSLMFLQTEGWKIADTPIGIIDNVFSTIYMIVLIFLILLYTCLPIDVVEFSTPTITYRIEATLKSRPKSIFSQIIKNLKEFPHLVLQKEMKRTFLLRLLVILILLLFGLVLSFIEFQFYLF